MGDEYSCAPMFEFFSAPPDGATTEFQISNQKFSDLLLMYYCEILNIGGKCILL